MHKNRLIKLLIITTIFIILLNVINELAYKPSWQFNRFINVSEEANFPTWFSSMLLTLAAYFAYKCSIAAKVKDKGQRILQLLSLGLLGMSCDEVAMIHESAELFINKHFLINKNWTMTIGPFILFLILIFGIKLKKCLKGSNKALKLLGIGALAYIGGAFIIEARNNFFTPKTLRPFLSFDSILEESFEMLGVIIIIKGLMEHYKFLLINNKV